MYEIKRLDELSKKLNTLSEDITKELQKVINKYGAKLLRDVKNDTPVDSGQLRRSWQSKKGKLYYSVYNNTEYGIYIEFGHRDRSGKVIDGRYMLTKACDKIEADFHAELQTILKRVGL